MGSEVVWSFSGIKWLPEPPEGDRRQREQALKVTSTCRCWRPRHRGRQAGLGAVTVTGSNTKANKVLRGKGCPVVCRNSARSLTAFLDHLNPRHVTRGLLCPVNSMQMFHDSATTEQGVAGTDFTPGTGGEGRQEAREMPPSLLSSSDPRGAQPPAGGPSPGTGLGSSSPSAASRNIPPPTAGTPVIMPLDTRIYPRTPHRSQAPGLAPPTVKAKFSSGSSTTQLRSSGLARKEALPKGQ